MQIRNTLNSQLLIGLALVWLTTSFASSASALTVVWARSTQNWIFCYPADANGKAYSGAQPIADRYCISAYGAQWARSQDGGVRCYPKSTKEMPAPTFAIDASWCVR